MPDGYKALVFGASGGIGSAIVDQLARSAKCAHVEPISRSSQHDFDVTDETALAALAARLANRYGKFHLIFDATGVLSTDGHAPEKSLKEINPHVVSRAFLVNAIGPALLLKHFSPLLAADEKSIFATLSARIGSIGDNRLGGWYAYRASKVALNQFVRTASIEIARLNPHAVCVALHPGTVQTALSEPFARGRYTHSSTIAAERLLAVMDEITPAQSGSFLAYDGTEIPW